MRLKTNCPKCGKKYSFPFMRVAIDVFIKECCQKWTVKVEPKSEPIKGMYVHEITWRAV